MNHRAPKHLITAIVLLATGCVADDPLPIDDEPESLVPSEALHDGPVDALAAVEADALELNLDPATREALGLDESLRIVDRRSWAAAHSSEVDDGGELARARIRRAIERGVDVRRSRRFAGLEAEIDTVVDDLALPELPPPGGVGWGVFYKDPQLLWEDQSLLVHRMIVPRNEGGNLIGTLYNTATNRSNLGVEALIHYPGQGDAHFRVFDWSISVGSKWVLDLPWADLAPYIHTVECADGTWRQEIEVWNNTVNDWEDDTTWLNGVLLKNQRTGNLDLVYSREYQLLDPTDNTFQPGEHFGEWGPIFETFQDHDGTSTPIGSNLTLLLQDGAGELVSSVNSFIVDGPSYPDPPIFNDDLSAWAVGTTVAELSTTMVEAEDLTHLLGTETASGKRSVPGDGTGWLVMDYSGAFGTPTAGKNYVAEFAMKITGPAGGNPNVAFVAVYDRAINAYVKSRWLKADEFPVLNRITPIRVEFSPAGGEDLAAIVYVTDSATVEVDRMTIVQQ